MQSLERKNRIIELLSRFVTQVRLYNAKSFTDINREAQNLFVEIFKIVYNLPKLRNLDLDELNFPAIDLADDGAQFAFQITSDPSTAKIRETLDSFTKHNLANQFNRVVIYVLTERHKTYDANFSENLSPGFNFNAASDIVDYKKLSQQIQCLAEDKQNDILAILEDEFGEKAWFQSAWTEQKFLPHASIYVCPKQFQEAKAILQKRGIVILSGPPHIGKTETAYELLQQASGDRASGSVRYLKSITDWNALLSLTGKKLLIDDPFGSTSFDNSVIADRFDDLLRLARQNFIAITSRHGILSDATEKTRLGETNLLDELIVNLKQEGSYDDSGLATILAKHITFATKSSQSGEATITDEQAQWILNSTNYIISELRFPHNIAYFVNYHAPVSSDYLEIRQSIGKAKDIARAVKLWFGLQDTSMKAVAAVAALFPGLSSGDAEAFISDLFQRLGLPNTNIASLLRRSSGYLRLSFTFDYEHPSYAEGVLLALQTDEIDLGWNIIRWRATTALTSDFFSLLQCRRAIGLLGLDGWTNQTKPAGRIIEAHDFLAEYIKTYNKILGNDFAPIRSSFVPGWNGEACVVGIMQPNDTIGSYAPLRRLDGDPLVTLIERSDSKNFIEPVLQGMALRVGQHRVIWSNSPDITRTIPQVFAVNSIVDQIKRSIKTKDGMFLNASWHIRLARLFRHLKSAEYPIETITKDNPLTVEQLTEWAEPYFHANGIDHILQTKPFRIFQIIPHRQSINDLNIPLAIEDINRIEESGHAIKEQLLPQPDLSWNEAVKIRNPRYKFDFFTTEHLRKAALIELQMYFEAYKQTAELSFPTICHRLPLYDSFPLEVICIVNVVRDGDPFDRVRMFTYLSPLDDAKFGEIVRVSVYMISDDTNAEEREYASSLLESRQYSTAGGFHSGDEEGWINHVVGDIARDVEYVLDDPDCEIRYYPPNTG